MVAEILTVITLPLSHLAIVSRRRPEFRHSGADGRITRLLELKEMDSAIRAQLVVPEANAG